MAIQRLQQRIGIRDGRGLRRGYKQYFPACHKKFQHSVGNSRPRIHYYDIRHGIQLHQILNNIIQIILTQVRHTRNTASPGDKPNIHGAPSDNIRYAFPLIDQITKIVLRHGAKHNFNICKAKIRIQNNDLFTHFTKLYRQINGCVGLSNSAFSACNSNDTSQGSYLLLSRFYDS